MPCSSDRSIVQLYSTLLRKIFAMFLFIFGLVQKLHCFGSLKTQGQAFPSKTKLMPSTVHLIPLSGGTPPHRIAPQISFPMVVLLLHLSLCPCGSLGLLGFATRHLGLSGLNLISLPQLPSALQPNNECLGQRTVFTMFLM